MTKTFEEIIFEKKFQNLFEDFVELMQLVRIKTLEEAASKAEADITFLPDGDKEVYVINSSILNLDKNSIEI